MQINVFVIIAQIVNFFILLVILQKVFYKPISEAMEKRQKKIDDLVADSESKAEKADELIEEYEEKLSQLEYQEKEALKEVREKADKYKEELLTQYKNEADRRKEEYLKEIEDDKRKREKELQRSLGVNSVKIAESILSYITDKSLEEKIFASFVDKIKRIEELDERGEISFDQEQFEVISARALSSDRKRILEDAIKEKFANFKEVDYAIDENLVLGHELRLASYVVNASVRKYVDQTELNIIKTIESKY
ncbi:MAG TPA: hypothetical protein DHN33_09095 [Eubacteriaceae bacterium]|nr:hypothetical protein [Eubacteriaceae bacterium]